MNRILALISLILLTSLSGGFAAATKLVDLEYAKAGEISLKLDLYIPLDAKKITLIVWVHGGAWRKGSKDSVSIESLVEKGYSIASIDYRLTPVAPFPANVHDIKAAIRFLRAHADRYGYDKEKIVVSGSSAGAHLAALVGVTNGHPNLEGKVGDHLDESSNIAAIVDFYGASNLTTILKQSTPHGLSVREPALDLLIGGHPETVPEMAKLASPVFHVDASDPPLLLIHGDQDPQMPINQAHEIHGAYKKLSLPVSFEVIHGGAHGGKAFFDAERLALVDWFLKKHLK